MRRFFVSPPSLSGATALISGPEAHHLIHVLRLGIGDTIELYDGSGSVYEARIAQLESGLARATILAVAKESEGAMSPELHLGQALLKGKNMDAVVQQATELGVASLQPFVSKYCVSRQMPADRERRRQERWARIALGACKQCGRPAPPSCLPVVSFSDLLAGANAGYDAKLIFWEAESAGPLDEVWDKVAGTAAQEYVRRRVLVLIGPEGGFSEEEVRQARAAGFQAVTLGRRVLRAETASLAVVAIIQHLLGNLR